MKGKKKTTKVEKHRGNPHGNGPSMPTQNNNVNSDDQLKNSVGQGVSRSPREKQ